MTGAGVETAIEEVIDEVDDTLCASCFDVLESNLNGKEIPKRPLFEMLCQRNAHCPLFVTWMKKAPDGSEMLRGCIGTLSGVSIARLGYYTKASAFNDTRFSPITAPEIPALVCGVSLLHTYEKAKDPHDWEIGKHGIIVEFDYNDSEYSATYLPEVALEHNMTKDHALSSLVRKAGFRGEVSEALMASLRVTRYQSKKFKLTYNQYKSL